MSLHDYVINNQSAPAFRADLNSALAAIASNNSSSSAPSTTYGGLIWFDTSANLLRIRNAANSAWVVLGEFDVANSRFMLISDRLQAASAGGIDVLNSAGTKIIDLQVASESTAQAGTNNTELMTPLRVAQAVPLPTGMITPFGGASAPSNWLLCHGQSLSTTTYAALHAVIGFTYGGSGSAFLAPDLRGRVPAGQDSGGANRLTAPINGDTLGAAGGSESHTLITTELSAHNHFVVADAEAGQTDATASTSFARKGVWGSTNNYQVSGTATGATTGLSSSTGGGQAHNNVQPTIILNYIIKT